MSSKPIDGLARGFRDRTWVTARLASKVGLKMLKKTLRPGASIAEVDEAAAVEAARRLVEELGGLKGLVMKFGQMASYMQGSLPPAAQRVLAELQAHTTPMAYGPIAAVLREELGADATELFESFSEAPFAAASIGQVHRARFRGRELAVKVQYPGVAEALKSDLKTIGRLLRFSTMLSALDGPGLVRELETRILEECDYQAEADNQEMFRALWASAPDVAVPEVVRERSTRRVLSAELSPGAPLQRFLEGASAAQRNHAGEVIFRTGFHSIFHHAVYNADPHPGNYLFVPDGRVVFLDFGCIKRFPGGFLDGWRRLARTLLEGRRRDFEEAFVAAGFVLKPKRFDFDAQWAAMRYLYEPFHSAEPFTFTHEYVSRSYDTLVFRNPNRLRMALPPDWLFVNRLQWGLNSVLAQLGATARWGEIFRAAIEPDAQELARAAS